MIMEYRIIRKQFKVLGVGESESALRPDLDHLGLLNSLRGVMMVHVAVDTFTLFNLNCLHPRLGVRFPRHLKGLPVLRIPEETSLIIRHICKLITRVSPINAYLVGARWNTYHGYTMWQGCLICVSPTVFAVLLAVKSKLGLLLLAISNIMFMTTVGYFSFSSFQYSEKLSSKLMEEFNHDPWREVCTKAFPIVFMAPYVTALVMYNPTSARYHKMHTNLLSRLFLGDKSAMRNPTTPDVVELSITRFRTFVTIFAGTVSSVIHWELQNIKNTADVTTSTRTGKGGSSTSSGGSLAPISGVLGLAAAGSQLLVPYLIFVLISSRWRQLFHLDFSLLATVIRAALVAFIAVASAASLLLWKLTTPGSEVDTSQIAWRCWFPGWLAVAVVSHATIPVFSPMASAFSAAFDLTVGALVLGAFAFDQPPVTPTLAFCVFGVLYLSSLHLSSLCSWVYAVVLHLLGVSPAFKEESDGNGGHWKMEDYEIDPLLFKLKPRHKEEDHREKGMVPLMHTQMMAQESAEHTAEATAALEARKRNTTPRQKGCNAEGCVRHVDEGNPITAAQGLCMDHITASKPFILADLSGSAPRARSQRYVQFCLMCRNLHAPPRCTDFRHSTARRDASLPLDVGGGNTMSPAGNATFLMQIWHKTHKGPEEAMNEMRNLMKDFSNELSNAYHMSASARPGCTLLTVDVLGKMDTHDDSESTINANHRTLDDNEEVEQHAMQAMGLLGRLGVQHGLQGNLTLHLQRHLGGFSQVRQVEFNADQHKPEHPLNWRIREHSFFPTDVIHPKLYDAILESANDAMQMPVIRSDIYDCVSLPAPPTGFSYMLRCCNRFIPIMFAPAPNTGAADFASDGSSIFRSLTRVVSGGAASSGVHDTCLLHIVPTHVEGLGFIELVADELGADDDGSISSAPRRSVCPIYTLPVFMTPDLALAHELSREDGYGARLGHAPTLYSLTVVLNANRGGGASSIGDVQSSNYDHSIGKEDSAYDLMQDETLLGEDRVMRLSELTYHAVLSCAMTGWAVACGRVLASQLAIPGTISGRSSILSSQDSVADEELAAAIFARQSGAQREQGDSYSERTQWEHSAPPVVPKTPPMMCNMVRLRRSVVDCDENCGNCKNESTDQCKRFQGTHDLEVERAAPVQYHEGHEARVNNPPLPMLFTTAGMAELLRAAASSCDSNTVTTVLTALIRFCGACKVGEMMTERDLTGKTPLHAAAAALAASPLVARRRQRTPISAAQRIRPTRHRLLGRVKTNVQNETVKAVTMLLTSSVDPLAWVSPRKWGNSYVETPAQMALSAGGLESDRCSGALAAACYAVSLWRAEKERAALNGAVIDVLTAAVVRACDLLHTARELTAQHNASRSAQFSAGRRGPNAFAENMGSSGDEMYEIWFANAATLAANEFDGTVEDTIAAAILSPGSSLYWHMLIQRDDEYGTKGGMSWQEAREWLNQGALAEGFPNPPATTVVSSRFGIKAFFYIALFNFVVNFFAFLFDSANDVPIAASVRDQFMVNIIQLLLFSSTVLLPARTYLRHHISINIFARLSMPAATVLAISITKGGTYLVLPLYWRLAGYVLQSVVAPTGLPWDPLVICAQVFMFPCADALATFLRVGGGVDGMKTGGAAGATTSAVMAAAAAAISVPLQELVSKFIAAEPKRGQGESGEKAHVD